MYKVLLAGISLFLVLQEGEAKKILEDVIKNVRSQKGYRISFESHLEIPDSDTPCKKGDITVVNPDCVYVNLEGSGGQKVEVIRKGDTILKRHPILEKWLPPEDTGDDEAGKGIQNPDHVLSVFSKYLDDARFNKSENNTVLVSFKGVKVKEVLAEHGLNIESVDWESAYLETKIWLNLQEKLLVKFSISATLVSTKEGMSGKTLKYNAYAKIRDYNNGLDLADVPADMKKRLGIKSP
jgi:hypothetical protein